MLNSDILRNLAELADTNKFDLTKEEILAKNGFLNRHMSDNPVEVEPGSWSTFDYGDYTAINKTYNFDSQDHFMYFINEVLAESKRMNHDPKLIIEYPKIEIVLYTHDFNDVTESDISLSKSVDEIYQDIFFLGGIR
jgi:pterin-4a-carbinolamine dehydratase